MASAVCGAALRAPASRRLGRATFSMDKTLPETNQLSLDGLTASQEGHRAKRRATRGLCSESGLGNPSGRTCCGSSKCCVPHGYSWSSRLAVEVLWLKPLKTFNALVTGAQRELLIANTGCPSGVPDGFSSHEWAQLGWPYGIVFTLTASEWKEGNTIGERLKSGTYQGKLHTRAAHSMGAVPTVCEAEYLQGFRRGSLHSWAREMRSQNQ
jgi:hypothetical protein